MLRKTVVFTLLALVLPVSCCMAQLAEKKVCVKGRCILVEIVDTDETRARGLMYRDSLDEDRGMLFVFPEKGIYNFWMMNMRFPIDILWIDEDLRIADIKENAQPCADKCPGFGPGAAAAYVLEVNAGFCSRNNVSRGDIVSGDIALP